MGLASRDYYREATSSSWTWGGATVIKYIIIANVVVYLLQLFWVVPPSISQRDLAKKFRNQQDEEWTEQEMSDMIRASQPRPVVQEWLELDTRKVIYQGQVWRLLTHAFCHARTAIFHIFFNMLFLFWFGRTLESMYGAKEFLLFYLTAAVVAALAFMGMQLYTGSNVPAIGASGAVMAVVMLYAMHFPRETVCICWFIPVEIRWLVLFYVIWDLHPLLLTLAGDELYTGVAHAAHLGGLAFGFVYVHFQWHLSPLVPSFTGRSLRSKTRLRLYSPRPSTCRVYTPDSEADRLDEILEKISVSGQDSLTEEERGILRAASEKLKTRARGS
jgi:membrane associated rhomboid family serine protease